MQDEGKILAQVYELILGRKIMNAIAGIGQHDDTIAVQIMRLAVQAKLGDMPAKGAEQKIDELVADFEQSLGVTDTEE
jgi:hypothetical protein